MTSCLHYFTAINIGLVDFMQRCADRSAYDIKVLPERFQSSITEMLLSYIDMRRHLI